MQKRQKILIADDDRISRRILNRILCGEYDIVEAVNGDDAIEKLLTDSENIAAILLDLIMPQKSGYEVLHFMQEHDLVNIPVIITTEEVDFNSEHRALELGAWDFIAKPYQVSILQLRLRNAITRSQMRYLSQIKHIAEHDSLTDFYNRRSFFRETEKMLKKHREEEAVFIRMDINRFRVLNSFFGEKEGDRLLLYAAEELKKTVTAYSWFVYGRIEADIFGICIPYEREHCESALKRLKERISEFRKDYLIDVSFGLYKIRDHTESVENMYVGASQAAKKCKEQFLVYINYYDSKMSEMLQQEQEILNEMQTALEQEEFLVYFQPKYNTQTRKPYGAEALVRWKHAKKGLISPEIFIPVFEKNGFIEKVDYYVWEKVCQYLKKWMEKGEKPAPVSVNMSRVELTNPNLPDILSGLVKKYGIPPDLLQLELTETSYMDNPEVMREMLLRLHREGFLVLIDDFGSGYSSLNTLKDMEVDILKVDMKFLTLDPSNSKSGKILSSVIRMAQWIGLPVITEGVETEAQYQFLKKIGCEYIQGYYFARPMPAEEYEHLIGIGAS